MYLIRLAFRPWRLAPLSQLFGVVSVGFLLLLIGFLFWLQMALSPVVYQLNKGEVVTAYLSPGIEDSKLDAISDEIRIVLGASSEPSEESTIEVRAVNADSFISDLMRVYPGLANELLGLGSEMKTVVPSYILVSGVLPESTLEKIKGISGIEVAESSQHRFKQTVGAFLTLQWIARILAIGLLIALISSLIQLTRMNAYLHSETLSLFRVLGANPFFLTLPGALSGAAVGFAGGLVALIGWWLTANGMGEKLRWVSPIFSDVPLPVNQLGAVLLILGAAAGLISGFLGAAGGAASSEVGSNAGVSS